MNDDSNIPPNYEMRPRIASSGHGSIRAGKRVVFCCGLTVLAAIPSYLTAVCTFDISFDGFAMLLVVAMYAAFWSAMAILPVVDQLFAVPFVRRTLAIGLMARLLFTVTFLPSAVFEEWLGHGILDRVRILMPGGFTPVGPGCAVHFAPTLLIATLDGAINSILLIVFMGCVWSLQLVVCKRPDSIRGYPVLTTAHSTDANSGARARQEHS